MTRWLPALALLALLCACTAATPPKEETTMPDTTPKPAQTFDVIAPLADQLTRDQWSDGLVVALVTPDAIEARAFGSLAAAGEPKAQSFEIGSVTKVFTGMALAALTEQGKVSPDTPLETCLPPGTKLPEGEPITLGQLATHTSGLPRLPVNMPLDPANPDPYAAYTVDQLLEGLGQTKLGPKTYAYSNLGAGLLGVALARCAGEPDWQSLIARHVTGPLGLDATSAGRALTTSGHDVNMDAAGAWRFDALAGAGALRSDAAQLGRLLQIAMSGESAMVRRSVEPLVSGPPKLGMGWHVGLEQSGPLAEVIWHNGMTGGWSSFIGYLPEQRLGVVVLSNTASASTDQLAAAALRALVSQPAELKLPPLAALDRAAKERLVGVYTLAPQAVFTIELRGDALWAGLTGQPSFRIWPESATRAHYRVVPATLEFVLPESGPATSLVLHQNGQKLPAPRLTAPEAN